MHSIFSSLLFNLFSFKNFLFLYFSIINSSLISFCEYGFGFSLKSKLFSDILFISSLKNLAILLNYYLYYIIYILLLLIYFKLAEKNKNVDKKFRIKLDYAIQAFCDSNYYFNKYFGSNFVLSIKKYFKL